MSSYRDKWKLLPDALFGFSERVLHYRSLPQEAEAHTDPWSAFVHRVTRHIDELQYLPAYLQTLPERISAGLLGLETAESGETLSRDSFGFNKLVVLATKRGKLYGLDTGNHGRIVWSKSSSETPGKRPWNVRAIYADDVNGIVTVRGADGEFIIVKSDTGKTVESIPTGLFPPVESAVLVDSEAGPWLLPIGEGGKIAELNSTWAPKQTIVTRTSDGGIRGVKFLTKGEQAFGGLLRGGIPGCPHCCLSPSQARRAPQLLDF